MTTSLKIIVIIGIVILCSLIGVVMNGGNGNSRAPIFVVIGALAAIRAVWKYDPKQDKKETDIDNQQLDKM